MDTRPIGMFDSGVGGLTVFSEIRREMPEENIIYLGDTGRFPYGTKSKSTIIEYAKQSINFLISNDVKVIVIACGTATSLALEELKKIYKIPIIGIIEPTVQEIAKEQKKLKVGVMATEGTIKSQAWQKELEKQIKGVEVINQACPLLAPMAEEGWIDNEIAKLTIIEYVKNLKDVDKVILGCTHYPLFTKLIQQELNGVEIVNTGEKVSRCLKNILEKEKMKNVVENVSRYSFYLTDMENKFLDTAFKFMKDKQVFNKDNIKKVILS